MADEPWKKGVAMNLLSAIIILAIPRRGMEKFLPPVWKSPVQIPLFFGILDVYVISQCNGILFAGGCLI